jgi:aminotransferase
VLHRNVLEQLADIAVEHDLLIFSDEAYEKIIYDDAKHISIGSLNGMDNHVLTFQTFSKTYAMCGYRIGYVAAPEAIAEAIKETHVNTTICAPTISQKVATEALRLPAKYTEAMVKEYDARRRLIVERLNDIGLPTPMPDGAFYTFSNIRKTGLRSRQFAHELLQKAKVAVVPGTDFGKNGEGYIRCSYAQKHNLIEKALDRMEKFVKAQKPKH